MILGSFQMYFFFYVKIFTVHIFKRNMVTINKNASRDYGITETGRSYFIM